MRGGARAGTRTGLEKRAGTAEKVVLAAKAGRAVANLGVELRIPNVSWFPQQTGVGSKSYLLEGVGR